MPIFEPAIASFYFDLSETIRIEKRVVSSLPEIFGEIGGLRDFLKEITFYFIAGFQARNFALD